MTSNNPEDASIYFDATIGGGVAEDGVTADVPLNGAMSVPFNRATGEVQGMDSSSSPVALSPVHTSLALGGCTPGLRRRREAGEKYATSISELGLRFQRRRRHFAGTASASNSHEEDSSNLLNGGVVRDKCAPLLDTPPNNIM